MCKINTLKFLKIAVTESLADTTNTEKHFVSIYKKKERKKGHSVQRAESTVILLGFKGNFGKHIICQKSNYINENPLFFFLYGFFLRIKLDI